MNKYQNEDLIRDAVNVCDDYYRSLNRATIQYLSRRPNTNKNDTLYYVESSTPYFLIKKGVLFEISNINDIKTTKLRDIAFRANSSIEPILRVRFNPVKVKQFLIDNSPDFRLYVKKNISGEEIWQDNFRYQKSNETLILPTFGKCSFFGKGRALLVELVTKSKEEGIVATSIQKEFLKRNNKKLSDREIDAMMIDINKRFHKCFLGTEVKIVNCGGGIKKRLKLSVIPSKP